MKLYGGIPVTDQTILNHQVEGLTKSDGGPLNYPETVVYWNDAIVPVGLVVYT
jgi:hypothetical protein